jgi:hypothetical protein
MFSPFVAHERWWGALCAADKERGVLHSRMKHLAIDFTSQWSLIAAEGPLLTIQTNAAAPRNRIVALDATTAAEGALSNGDFTEVLAQHPKDLLQVPSPAACSSSSMLLVPDPLLCECLAGHHRVATSVIFFEQVDWNYRDNNNMHV